MARIMIELRDDLASRAAEAGVDIDYLAEEAVREHLEARDFERWLQTMQQPQRS